MKVKRQYVNKKGEIKVYPVYDYGKKYKGRYSGKISVYLDKKWKQKARVVMARTLTSDKARSDTELVKTAFGVDFQQFKNRRLTRREIRAIKTQLKEYDRRESRFKTIPKYKESTILRIEARQKLTPSQVGRVKRAKSPVMKIDYDPKTKKYREIGFDRVYESARLKKRSRGDKSALTTGDLLKERIFLGWQETGKWRSPDGQETPDPSKLQSLGSTESSLV